MINIKEKPLAVWDKNHKITKCNYIVEIMWMR